jgi:SAM-dependent methyltransferase
MTGCFFDPPSPFVAAWIRKLSNDLPGQRRALDVAMGRGRHALPLAALGFDVYGVDIAFEAIADACARGRARGLLVRAWCADLTVSRVPAGRFELIVVTRYLQRSLCADLVEALTPGGVLLYETFTEHQRGRGRGPQSPDHLLKVGELRSLFAELDQLFYEELTDPADDALARLAARKRSKPS